MKCITVQAHPLATGHAPPLNIQSQGHTSRHVQTTVGDTVDARVGSCSQFTVHLHSLLYVELVIYSSAITSFTVTTIMIYA